MNLDNFKIKKVIRDKYCRNCGCLISHKYILMRRNKIQLNKTVNQITFYVRNGEVITECHRFLCGSCIKFEGLRI